MKCCILFSKKKMRKTALSSAEFAQKVVMVKLVEAYTLLLVLQNTEVGRIAELKEECIRQLDSEVHMRRTASLVSGNVDISVIYSVAVICHCLMSQQKFSIHRRRFANSCFPLNLNT